MSQFLFRNIDMTYLGVSPSGSLQRSQPRCHLGLQVASHGLIGAGCASQFTQRVLAGLSSSQAVELRAPVPHRAIGQSPLSVPCHVNLSNMAACFIRAYKLTRQEKECASKRERLLERQKSQSF